MLRPPALITPITSLIALLIAPFFALASTYPPLEKLQLPPGFKANLYAYPVPGARSMALGKDGTIYVGSRREGKVYALLPDKNSDGKSDEIRTIIADLNSPNGVAFHDGALYVAEIHRILRFPQIDPRKTTKEEAWGPSFPGDKLHGWKFIAFGPDNWLYVPVGAPCNICLKNPDLYAAIHRISPDGKKREIVARGVRNSVGFDWHPETKQLWFTDNGRDWLGDDSPPDELNHLEHFGEHFGYPFCHGKNILDPELGKGKSCANYRPPELELPAHSANLGMRFLRTQNSPLLKNAILIAQHGSWNRSSAVGYELVLAKKENGKWMISTFASGFRDGKEIWGRPVDVLENGTSIFVSDDQAGAIYRITYEGKP